MTSPEKEKGEEHRIEKETIEKLLQEAFDKMMESIKCNKEANDIERMVEIEKREYEGHLSDIVQELKYVAI